MLINTAVKS